MVKLVGFVLAALIAVGASLPAVAGAGCSRDDQSVTLPTTIVDGGDTAPMTPIPPATTKTGG